METPGEMKSALQRARSQKQEVESALKRETDSALRRESQAKDQTIALQTAIEVLRVLVFMYCLVRTNIMSHYYFVCKCVNCSIVKRDPYT